jgi:hypothetical protein
VGHPQKSLALAKEGQRVDRRRRKVPVRAPFDYHSITIPDACKEFIRLVGVPQARRDEWGIENGRH